MLAESSEAARILVIDDERVIREILAEFLSLEGFSVHTVEDGEEGLTELRLHPYDVLITDLKMPRLSGLQLLEKIEAERLGVLTVLMTGFGTVETAIEGPGDRLLFSLDSNLLFMLKRLPVYHFQGGTPWRHTSQRSRGRSRPRRSTSGISP